MTEHFQPLPPEEQFRENLLAQGEAPEVADTIINAVNNTAERTTHLTTAAQMEALRVLAYDVYKICPPTKDTVWLDIEQALEERGVNPARIHYPLAQLMQDETGISSSLASREAKRIVRGTMEGLRPTQKTKERKKSNITSRHVPSVSGDGANNSGSGGAYRVIRDISRGGTSF